MKINLNDIDRTNFEVKEGIIAGEKCYLVNPRLDGTDWNENNLIFTRKFLIEKWSFATCTF